MASTASLCTALLLTSFSTGWSGTVSEDFESYTAGTTGSAAGWMLLTGESPVDKWSVEAVEQPAGNDSSLAFVSNGGQNSQIYKPFLKETGINETTQKVYYTAWVSPLFSGSVIQNVRFGLRAEGQQPVFLFGVEQGEPGAKQFHFSIGESVSTDSFPAQHWYEVQLVLDLSGGPGSASGSLFARDATTGDGGLVPLNGLQDVPVTLPKGADPSQWSAWVIRSQYRQLIDNLTLSTEPTPNP
jgi:hypothetical protein